MTGGQLLISPQTDTNSISRREMVLNSGEATLVEASSFQSSFFKGTKRERERVFSNAESAENAPNKFGSCRHLHQIPEEIMRLRQ